MSDEAVARRRRTNGYLALWKLDADLAAVDVVVSSHVHVRADTEVCDRALAHCLLALKGQGLSQLEVFAFADAYVVWDALDGPETDFILDIEPSGDAVIAYAWRYEALHALEWALGLNNHLVFPVDPVDPAKALRICIEGIAARRLEERPHLRPLKDVLDGLDVARCLAAIAGTARSRGQDPPGGMHPGVVHERDAALNWLVQPDQPVASG